MGNLCNCLNPTKTVDDDYEYVEVLRPSEIRRCSSKTNLHSSVENVSEMAGIRRKSYESCCYDEPAKNQENVFTISQSCLPWSPVVVQNAQPSLLDSLEMSLRHFPDTEKQPKARIWSLRPENFLLHSSRRRLRVNFASDREESLTSLSTSRSSLVFTEHRRRLSSCESFDSGFTDTSVAIDSAIHSTCGYLVIEQPSASKSSMFHYLFDLSRTFIDSLFEWPTAYVCKLKQNLTGIVRSQTPRALKWDSRRRRANVIVAVDESSVHACPSSNAIEKPLGIMGLLSKLNLFNLFRTVAAVASTTAQSTYGFNPLRDLFLRFFDINFF